MTHKQASPTQASPTQASPTQASPTQASPTQASPTQASPTQASPTQASPTRVTRTQAAPITTRLPAAVLLPLVWQDNDWQLLFIRRAERLGDQHSGQVAFPGGRVEPSDANDQAAALRETEEEIGLSPARVEVIAQLPRLDAGMRYTIAPFVGKVRSWPTALTLSPDEVASVFSIPLSWLANPRHHQRQPYKAPNGQWRQVTVYQPFGEHLLWGASANMTHALLQAIEQGSIRL